MYATITPVPTFPAPSTVLATDAVVPADAEESILSWDLTGTLLIYLAEPRPGRVEARVVDFSMFKSMYTRQRNPIMVAVILRTILSRFTSKKSASIHF